MDRGAEVGLYFCLLRTTIDSLFAMSRLAHSSFAKRKKKLEQSLWGLSSPILRIVRLNMKCHMQKRSPWRGQERA
jgi:hypothetical protein